MTQLLEQAFTKATRELSEAEQNMLAQAMLHGMRHFLELAEQEQSSQQSIEIPETAILSEC